MSANQCYFNGEFYQCKTATAAGESPATHPAKWVRVQIPAAFRLVLAGLTYARLLELDGQKDKAAAERAAAVGLERTGLEALIRREVNAETAGGPDVQSHGTVKAETILEDAYHAIGWDADQLELREQRMARSAFSQALQEVWEAWWWHHLMRCEQVQFAETWYQNGDRAFYNADEIVYWPATDAYYQSLVIENEARPADDAGVTSPFWLRITFPSQPETFDRWSATAVYVPGDKVTHFALDNTTQLRSDRNFVAKPDAFWTENKNDEPFHRIEFDESGTRHWSEIVLFSAYLDAAVVPVYGAVRQVSRFNPIVSNHSEPFDVENLGSRLRVVDLTVGRPWVWHRRVTPILTGDEFSNTATYAATPASELVFDS